MYMAKCECDDNGECEACIGHEIHLAEVRQEIYDEEALYEEGLLPASTKLSR